MPPYVPIKPFSWSCKYEDQCNGIASETYDWYAHL